MTIHTIWVDEAVDYDGGEHLKLQAVCGTCLWSSRWVHEDEFDYLPTDPYDSALSVVKNLGLEEHQTGDNS